MELQQILKPRQILEPQQILDAFLCINLSGGGGNLMPSSDIRAKHNPLFDCTQFFHQKATDDIFYVQNSIIFDIWLLSWLQFARSKLSEIASEVD